jgi:hypothetical protein
MRKLIAAINMTLEGFCDHTAMIADEGQPKFKVALAQLELIDEYQFGVQPIVLGSGLPLFKNVKDRIDLKLLKTKTFCGAVTLYYEPTKK